MTIKSLIAYLRDHPILKWGGAVLIAVISGVSVNYIYYDVIWHEHERKKPDLRGPEHPAMTTINPVSINRDQPTTSSSTNELHTTRLPSYTQQQAELPSKTPPSKSAEPSSHSEAVIIQAPSPTTTHKDMVLDTSHAGIRLYPTHECCSGFNSFDSSALTNAIEKELKRHNAFPTDLVKISLAAGYRSESNVEDTGTTIQAYATFMLNGAKDNTSLLKLKNVDCNKPCIYGDNNIRNDNISDAIDSIAKSIASFIQYPQAKGELQCAK